MIETVLEAVELTRDYGRTRALSKVNLQIGQGKIVALLGPNGAGKSTLLRLLSGLIEPTAGRAFVMGRDARGARAAAPGRLAALHEGHEPAGWATPERLIALEAEACPGFDRKFAEEFCFAHGVARRTPYGALSKGQRRWILSGLTLASGADVMLFDEPADGLDPAARHELYDALRARVNEREGAALVATHIVHDIERVADEAAIIQRGWLTLYGALEDLREQVREVELPAGESLEAVRLALGEEILRIEGKGHGTDGTGGTHGTMEILARREVGDGEGELLTVRLRDEESEGALREALPEGAAVRRMGLEELYLALTAAPKDKGQLQMTNYE